MVDAGIDTREMIVIIGPERRRTLRRRRIRPPTSAVYRLNSLCPVAPCFAQPYRGPGAHFFYASSARILTPIRTAVFSVFGQSSACLRDGIVNNSFLELPPRPQWGHSSTTRRGEDIPLFTKDGERDTGVSLSFKKRWPRSRGGSLCLF